MHVYPRCLTAFLSRVTSPPPFYLPVFNIPFLPHVTSPPLYLPVFNIPFLPHVTSPPLPTSVQHTFPSPCHIPPLPTSVQHTFPSPCHIPPLPTSVQHTIPSPCHILPSIYQFNIPFLPHDTSPPPPLPTSVQHNVRHLEQQCRELIEKCF